MPISAPAHTSTSRIVLDGGSSAATVIGVYVPAMSRKMLEWSIRRRSAVARGDQVRR